MPSIHNSVGVAKSIQNPLKFSPSWLDRPEFRNHLKQPHLLFNPLFAIGGQSSGLLKFNLLACPFQEGKANKSVQLVNSMINRDSVLQ